MYASIKDRVGIFCDRLVEMLTFLATIIIFISYFSGIVAFLLLIFNGRWRIALLGVLLGIIGKYIVTLPIGLVSIPIVGLAQRAINNGRRFQSLFWIILVNAVSFVVLLF